MIAVKRVEIVIDAAHTPELVRVVKHAGAPGYTLLRDVQGFGDRGDRSGDGLGNVYRNCYLVTAVSEDIALIIAEKTRPLLERYGGICLISDAQLLPH
jgi:nitrogen regulatory protein PII